MTDPQTIAQWWGPPSLSLTVAKMEPWSGGNWQYLLHDTQGNEWAFHGVYHSIVVPLQTIYTYEWEGQPGHVSLETVTFEHHETGTKVTSTSVFQSIEDRDAMLVSEMQADGDQKMERLAKLLADLQPPGI